MKKNLIVKQIGYKECGAASLLSIIRYYHGNISMQRLVELTNTTNDGTTLYDIKQASNELNLEAIGYKVDDITKLKDIKKPFICQIISHNYEHFIVIYEVKKNKVIAMDPAVGESIMNLDELKKIWTSYIMIFSPKKKLIYQKEEKYINKIIINTLKTNKRIVLDIQILSIIFMIVSLISTLYFEIIIDKVANTNILLGITFIFACLILLKCITNLIRNELLIYLNQKLDCSIILNTFQKLILLPYNYYKNKSTGEIIARINDLINVKNMINKLILTVCLDIVILISFSLFLLINYAKLFIYLVIIIVINVILFYLFRPRLKRYTEIIQNNTANINSELVQTISSYETIKNMHLESFIQNKLEKNYIEALKDIEDYNHIINLEEFMKEIISGIGIHLVQFISFYLIINNQMSLSNIITFTFLTNYMINSMNNILELFKDYYYVKNSTKRANYLFEVESENLEKKTNFVLKGNIKINNLSYGYRDSTFLNNINIQIKEGEKVLILGESGSGKSTLLKLLLKYYQVNRNNIFINDIDINDIAISNIREEIACISQNEFLYDDTIKNNIVAGKKITEEEFLEIAKLTYVDEFIKELFLGYDTKLEENGLNLSGGQRQRIMLARMLLKPSKIMLIDEGLNAIDINLERKILKNIFSKYKEKTIIVVSHRLENIDLFEQLIYLENGTIKKTLTKPKEKLL